MREFEDKCVVITGAGGLICSELAKGFFEQGTNVALLDLNFEKALQVAKDIDCSLKKVKAYECNVLDKNSLKTAKMAINKDFGSCDILINGAGGNNPKATTDLEFASSFDGDKKDFFALDESAIKFVFDLNILGTILPCQVFCQDMIGRQDCSVLNISSMNAFKPLTKIPAYSAAKAGVSNFTEWLSVYFAKINIRVNAIAPGFFATNQNQELLFDKNGNLTERSEKIINATPMQRFGKVDELVQASLFLTSSKKASFITGVVLAIDGGFNAYSGV